MRNTRTVQLLLSSKRFYRDLLVFFLTESILVGRSITIPDHLMNNVPVYNLVFRDINADITCINIYQKDRLKNDVLPFVS